MINPDNLHKCSECSGVTFKIEIEHEYDMLLYECCTCGYIHSHWFVDTENFK